MSSATERPRLFSFDIFGTVLDWVSGLGGALGRPVGFDELDRFVDFQGRDEQASFRPYREITARSLVEVFGVDSARAERVGARVGQWPLFADSVEGMRRLQAIAPCAATTNSDRAHGVDVQAQLGFPLSYWFCAEELRRYKPDPGVWREVAARLEVPLDRRWWHVSAYGDYDLTVARALGLTCVYVERPHRRPGPADVTVPDLIALAGLVENL